VGEEQEAGCWEFVGGQRSLFCLFSARSDAMEILLAEVCAGWCGGGVSSSFWVEGVVAL